MWRDPYYRSWGERLVSGLLALLLLALGARLVAEVMEPFIPAIVGLLVLALAIMWMLRRRW